jgi:mRNA-capping enzyme
VNCKGHGEAPSEQVKTFNTICQNYLDKFPNDIIGVHCTHGFNRSGYLICAFLNQNEDWDIRAALACFAKLRAPGIYKQDYINKLCEDYGTPEEDPPKPPPKAPALPDWCFEDQEENDDDGFATTSNGSSSLGRRPHDFQDSDQPRQKRRKENFKANPTFMDGVTGVIPVTDRKMLAILQQRVQDMCEWRGYYSLAINNPVHIFIFILLLLQNRISWWSTCVNGS